MKFTKSYAIKIYYDINSTFFYSLYKGKLKFVEVWASYDSSKANNVLQTETQRRIIHKLLAETQWNFSMS